MKLLEKPYLTEQELSSVLNVSIHTLQKQRRQGRGIRFCRVGRCVRYASKDVLEYLEQNSFDSTSQYNGGDNA